MNQQDSKPLTREEYFSINGIVDHCFSPDGKFIAISMKRENLIEIYELRDIYEISSWKLVRKLKDQSMTISSIAWSVQDKILSCSYDRSIMVWNSDGTRDLVIVENQRAALVGKWSNTGKKFIVGGGDHKAFLGYFDDVQNWWQTKRIQGFKSSIISVAFHPSGRVVACGSSDYTIKVITACIEDDNQKFCPQYEDLNYKGPYSNLQSFGIVLFSHKNIGGWVQDLQFSPQGNYLVINVHNGTLQLCCVENTEDPHEAIQYKEDLILDIPCLPFKKILFKSNEEIIAGGFDGIPSLLKIINGKLVYEKVLSKQDSKASDLRSSKVSGIKSMWESKQLSSNQVVANKKGKADSGRHLTPILTLNSFPKNPQKCFTSSDIQGQILFWDV